jgi:hypothetical protein
MILGTLYRTFIRITGFRAWKLINPMAYFNSLNEVSIIRQNFTALLYAPEISSDLLPAKREPVSVTRDK